MISDPNLDKHYRSLAALWPSDAARRALAACTQSSDAAYRALAACTEHSDAAYLALADCTQSSDAAYRALAACTKPAVNILQEQQRQADAMRLEIASLCREMPFSITVPTETLEEVWSTLPPDPNFGFRPNRW